MSKIAMRKMNQYSELFYSKCGKTWNKITPNTDTFHAVRTPRISNEFDALKYLPLSLI